jgi:hypothetical protein
MGRKNVDGEIVTKSRRCLWILLCKNIRGFCSVLSNWQMAIGDQQQVICYLLFAYQLYSR